MTLVIVLFPPRFCYGHSNFSRNDGRREKKKDWFCCIKTFYFFSFWSEIFAILRNIPLHLQYGQWFIEQATSAFCPGFMWNVLTLYWCLAACGVARAELELIKSVARSKNHPPSLLPMSPPHLAMSRLLTITCLFICFLTFKPIIHFTCLQTAHYTCLCASSCHTVRWSGTRAPRSRWILMYSARTLFCSSTLFFSPSDFVWDLKKRKE